MRGHHLLQLLCGGRGYWLLYTHAQLTDLLVSWLCFEDSFKLLYQWLTMENKVNRYKRLLGGKTHNNYYEEEQEVS